jgi:hypothetical protein
MSTEASFIMAISLSYNLGRIDRFVMERVDHKIAGRCWVP